MNTPNVIISTELMKNYKQAEIMSPEKKFEALQTSTGCSLLFSIGTDNVFYVTEETIGHATGWQKTDLSTAQLPKSFPGQPGLSCQTFEAAQSAVDGTIGLAMVVGAASSTTNHLFLCLGNSSTDMSWLQAPAWVQYPFDNTPAPAGGVSIVNVFLSETADNTQFIVVDILRDPTSPEKLISRYYINPSPAGQSAWQPHDVAFDLEATSYASCLGRQYLPSSPHQPTIDGLYTLGQVDGRAQFTFQPLYNVFNPAVPAAPARLQLPGQAIGTAMAACRKPNLSTDLYVSSGNGLYYFVSSNQTDGCSAVLLFQNDILRGIRKMCAVQAGNMMVVWGLNGNNEIFYTSCPVGQELATPSAWSYPLPIVSGVDLFSPYLNVVDQSNTFFVVAANTLQKLVKSPDTTIWKAQSITLPTLQNADTQKYSSYTTRIHVTDANSAQPLVNYSVTISAPTRTAVYINHLYYVLDPVGIQVNTDELGSVTVIEWVSKLTGTQLTVTAGGGTPVVVNPMDKPFATIAGLNTAASLQSATIPQRDGNTKPLVSGSASAADLTTVAQANVQMGQAYAKLAGSKAAPAARPASFALAARPAALQLGGLGDAIVVEAGDLFRWLESGVEAAISLVEDVAGKVWHFVVKIADQVYSSLLDAVEKVVGAIEWIYNLIKTAIEDLIQFLEFLFEWNDILRTHRVMKNTFIQLTQHSVDSLQGYKADIAAVFKALQNDVNKWANIPSFGQTPAGTTASTPALAGQHSAPANLGLHHYQGNAANATSSFTPASLTTSIFQDLLDLLNQEEATLTGAYSAIKTDIIEQFNDLSVTQIIQKFVAIVADTLLQTAENILLAVVDVFVQLTAGLIELLTEPLDIPVLSWLYQELTGDQLSFLDVICLIGAIPATIVYKLAGGSAPFPANDAFTDALLGATSFTQVQQAFLTPSAADEPMARLARPLPAATSRIALSDTQVLNETRLKTFGVVTGFFALIGSGVLIVTSAVQRILDETGKVGLPNARPKTLALISALGNVAYVSPNIATFINASTDNWYQQMNNVLTGISLIKGFVNIPLTLLDDKNAWAKVSPGIESVINVVWLVPVIMNVNDNHSRWDTDYKSLIPETIGDFAFDLGGILELPIALTEDIEAKAIGSAIQYGLMLTYGICMPIAGGIYEWAPGQNHGEE